MKVFTAFLDLLAAYDSIPREKLWRHLQKIKTPQYLRDIIQTMYTGCLYLLIDGDKISGEVAPNKGLKQGCPLSPLLYSLFTNDIDRFLTVQRGAATALDSVQVSHCDYADDIALTSNTAECLQRSVPVREATSTPLRGESEPTKIRRRTRPLRVCVPHGLAPLTGPTRPARGGGDAPSRQGRGTPPSRVRLPPRI